MTDIDKTALDYSGEPIWPLRETTVTCPCGNVFTSQKEPKCCPACGVLLCCTPDKPCCCEAHDLEGGCRQ